MLNAILSGKARSVLHTDGSIEAVRAILVKFEDPRTATIFERISYMPGPLAWELIRRSTGSVLRGYRFAELIDIQFWPNWFMEAAGRSFSQPDIFLRWEVGDPAVRLDMIIEAKQPTGGGQNPSQWEDQLQSYADHVHIAQDSDEAPIGVKQIIYICVDGLGERPAERVTRLSLGFQLPTGLPPVTIGGCSWQSMADSLGEMVESNELSSVPTALTNDLVRAFAFLGHAHLSIPDALLDLDYTNQPTESLRNIQTWNIK